MRTKFTDRLLLPAIVGVTTALAALILCERLLIGKHAEIQATTKTHAAIVKDRLESELKARVLSMDQLAGRWQARGQSSDLDKTSEAALLMNGESAYQGIEWVDSTLHVRWVAPQIANRPVVAVDPGSNERVSAALGAAGESGRVVVTGPVPLHGGWRGLFVCAPVFMDEKLSGFLLGAVPYQELFSTSLQELGPNYGLVVYDSDEEIYSRGRPDSTQAQAWAQETNIEFRQLSWRVRVWPQFETLAIGRSSLPTAVLLGGILVAGLLAFVVYMGETAHLHALNVAATNKELQKEIAGREQAEEALRQAQKMEAVGRLAGGVAHDFNNLLMVIRGRADLLLNHLDPDNLMRHELTEILNATDRASSLTRQLLALSRKQVLQPKVLDLNSIVTQAAELLPPALGESITLSLELDSDLGAIKADAARMEQVIINLAFNARDAMPGGGKLTIQTANTDLDESWTRRHPDTRPGPHVMLEVRDNGCGMDQKTQSHIFEPFFTTKEGGKGTGLGLATVYGTISQSGGSFVVSSKVGEGTSVQIYLPRVDEAIEAGEKPKAFLGSGRGNATVLLVEDDDAVRRMTGEFLKIKGYAVVEARSPEDAIRCMEQHNPIDLVLTDVTMPRMNGPELVEHLVKLSSGLKVLYMSAYTEDAAITSGMLGPGTAFIEKPFSPDELACKVQEALGVQTDRHGAEYERHDL